MLIAVFFPLDSLLAGIPQKVKFTVTTGHYTVKNGDSLQLSNIDAMLILCPEENRAVIYSNARGKGHSRAKAGLWPWCAPSGSKALSSAHPRVASKDLSPCSSLLAVFRLWVDSNPAPRHGVTFEGIDIELCRALQPGGVGLATSL